MFPGIELRQNVISAHDVVFFHSLFQLIVMKNGLVDISSDIRITSDHKKRAIKETGLICAHICQLLCIFICHGTKFLCQRTSYTV